MAVKWTDEQLLAINTTDRGVVVPAAAGSGKTAVLIERTVRLLAQPDPEKSCPAERLLAVTFTKDAAEQMKRKLRTALGKKISELGRSDPELCRWLESQQEMLELANISTINSFCLELVKSELSEFDYRSGIRIADETDAAAITAEAMTITLEQLRAESPEQVELLIDALTNDSDRTLAEEIENFRKFTRSLAFPESWVESVKKQLSDPAFADECAARIIDEKLSPLLQKAMKQRESAEYAAAKLADSVKYLGICQDDLEILEDIFTALRSRSWKTVYGSVQKMKKFPVMRKPSEKGLTQEEIISQQQIFDELKSARELMKESVKALKEAVYAIGEEIYEPMKNSAYVFSALAAAARRLEEISMEIKHERGLAEFGDVERMAMQLLVTEQDGKAVRTPFAERLRAERRYAVLLIDEFQDVNNLQEMIFCALSDTDDLGVLGKNVFVVGDIKQSIYRFRQSNPKLFTEAVQKAQRADLPELCEIRLTRNFRSRQSVIDLANALFSTVMSKRLGGVEYSCGSGEALVCGADLGGDDPPCELMLVEEDPEDDGELNEIADFGAEEIAVANRIKYLYESGITVYDGGNARAARLSDFCVLARGHSSCRRAAAAIRSVGLKVQSEQTDGYMGSREIMIMVDLLKVIDDPLRDLPLAAVMLSPIMGFTVEELAKLRLRAAEDTDDPMRLHLVLTRAAKDENSVERERSFIDLHDEVLQQKCRSAVELLQRLDFYSVSLPLSSLITKIYDETGFFAAASAYEDPKQRRANLRMLTQYAAAYEKNNSGGIAGFLRYLERVSESKGDFKQAVTQAAGEDAVAVKTFHSSKGLEYPVVILCGLNKAFSTSDSKKRILLHEYGGAGIKYMRHDCLMNVDTVARLSLLDELRREQLSEEMRLLYVAVTRAKERLILPIFLKEGNAANYNMKIRLAALADELAAAGGANSRLLGECRCFAEWVAAFVMQSEFNEPLLNAVGRGDLAPQLAAYAKYPPERKPFVEWSAADISLPDTAAESAVRHSPDPAKVSKLREKYAMKYSGSGETSASKRTVTEIVAEMRREESSDEATDHSFFPQLGSLEEQAGRLTAAQRGTFTHLFMELADYSRAEKDVRAELKRLTACGRMTENEAKGVYVNALERFFAGSFYRRMKRSDEIKRELKFMVSADDAGLDGKFLRFIDSGGMLQGVCDCIFREPDGYVLVDYKTDGFTDISQLDSYHVQLELYKSALDVILPLPVKACYIYSFKLAQGKEITL